MCICHILSDFLTPHYRHTLLSLQGNNGGNVQGFGGLNNLSPESSAAVAAAAAAAMNAAGVSPATSFPSPSSTSTNAFTGGPGSFSSQAGRHQSAAPSRQTLPPSAMGSTRQGGSSSSWGVGLGAGRSVLSPRSLMQQKAVAQHRQEQMSLPLSSSLSATENGVHTHRPVWEGRGEMIGGVLMGGGRGVLQQGYGHHTTAPRSPLHLQVYYYSTYCLSQVVFFFVK